MLKATSNTVIARNTVIVVISFHSFLGSPGSPEICSNQKADFRPLLPIVYLLTENNNRGK